MPSVNPSAAPHSPPTLPPAAPRASQPGAPGRAASHTPSLFFCPGQSIARARNREPGEREAMVCPEGGCTQRDAPSLGSQATTCPGSHQTHCCTDREQCFGHREQWSICCVPALQPREVGAVCWTFLQKGKLRESRGVPGQDRRVTGDCSGWHPGVGGHQLLTAPDL